jgi:branched-chain amino acid transport system permease protein
MGSIYGAVGGALLLIGLTEGLRSFSEYRLWVYTLILILILFFVPSGLIAPAWMRVRDWINGRGARFVRRASA